MSGWLRQHRQAARLALRRLGLLNALVVGVALSLPAGGYVLLDNLRALGAGPALEPQISLFLHPGAKRAEAEALGKTLRADRRFSKVRFVPREDALRDLAAVQGVADVVAAIGHNPLPDTFVVIAPGHEVGKLSSELAKLPGVAHVQADAVWARRLAAAAGVARLALWMLTALLGVGLVAVTFNTIRLQILTQRAEIEVSKLIGATDAIIRRPFYYTGFLQGVAGGLVALALVSGALALLNREVALLADAYGSAFRLGWLAAGDAAGVVFFAGLLGLLGAQLAVARQLREIEPA
jgi:cell division transport system permease protein